MNASTLTKTADDIAHYAGYPLFVVGTLANIVCIFVLIRPRMRATNIGFYLLALSVNDIFVLDVSLMDKWLRHSHGIQPRLINLFLCKLLPFLDKFFLQMSSWIVVVVSMERLVAVCIPIRYRNAKKWYRPFVLLIIIIVIAAVNVPILYFYELGTKCATSAPKSYIQPKYVIFYLLYWAFPLLCLLISSTVIVCKLQSNKFVEESTEKSQRQSKKKLGNKESVYLILFINFMFIACISPFAICGILITVLDQDKLSITTVQSIWAAYVISHVFSYLNNAINFVPYMMTSSVFRKELKALFRIKSI